MGPMVLAAVVAGAAPVVLQPELRPGRTVRGRAEIRMLDEDPTMAMAPIEVLTSRQTTEEGEVILTTRTPLPAGLSLLHRELLVQHALRYAEDGGVAESRLLRSDFGAILGWLGLSDADIATLPADPAVLVSTGCSPLGFQAALPAGPVEVGASWTVGDLACTLDGVEAQRARVSCTADQRQEDPWALFTIHEERELVVDLDQRLVAGCTSTRRMRRELDPATVQSWGEAEIYEAEVGDPERPGMALTTKILGVAGAGLAGVVGLLAWLVRRSRR